jgi:hypothetical protein
MLKFNELKKGDYVIADNDGDPIQGMVTGLKPMEKEVCVDNGTQEFWFHEDHLSPISISEEQLTNLKFHKQENEDGTVKYMKGAFRMLVPVKGDFSKFDIWYRDEKRHIMQTIPLHKLQNHFFEMTKVHLDDSSFD